MKRMSLVFACSFFCVLLLGLEVSAKEISFSGCLENPLSLSLQDLHSYQSLEVRANEVLKKDDSFHGVFIYRGVPLKNLLQTASIKKSEGGFNKHTDLGVLITNSNKDQVVLSWGEIFYSRPAHVTIAYEARPFPVHEKCQRCHKPSFYKPIIKKYHRPIDFPKLIVSDDKYTDRCLEGITSIEVFNPADKVPEDKGTKGGTLYSKEFTVTGQVNKTLVVKDVRDYATKRENITLHQVGDRGYHGTKTFAGFSFKQVLRQAKVSKSLDLAILVSAPDGYRSLLSYGEVFLSPRGDRMLLANRLNDEKIDPGGKYMLVIPDDFMADRWIKSVSRIRIFKPQDPEHVR